MKKLLLPIILLLVGTGAGVGAGIVLKPEPEPEEIAEHGDAACLPTEHVEGSHEDIPVIAPVEDVAVEYVEMDNQFVVPVIADDAVAAMVVVSLSIEVPTGGRDAVTGVAPKLRDVFLHAMFDHANIGGFSGNFTSNNNMRVLREDLLREAQGVIGETARDVLIVEIVRQDI